MTQEIESVKPILTVIDDEGDLILSSTGARGKRMLQSLLAQATDARKVTALMDGEMKVMKRSGKGASADLQPRALEDLRIASGQHAVTQSIPAGPDIQDQFAADLEAGVTGEVAMGETPAPTPGPNDPTPVPVAKSAARRPKQIFQDAAAPPAPETAEAEMAALLAEAAQAEQDAVKVQEERRFQAQQAIQTGEELEQAEPAAKPTPRKREPRQLAVTGRPCGKCGGSGQTGIQTDAGAVFAGPCAVCGGKGTVQTFDRGPKFR